MAFTYDPASTAPLDSVRRWCGDLNASAPLVDDEVILADLGTATDEVSIIRTAAKVARWCLVQVSRDPDRSIEGLTVTRARIEAYQEIVRDLEARAGTQSTSLATMSAGNISISSDAVILEDTDYKPADIGYLDERVGDV